MCLVHFILLICVTCLFIQITPALPKTRSGKIMRRLLKKIARNDLSDLGDTTTLAEPQVVQMLCDAYVKHIQQDQKAKVMPSRVRRA
jgi:hypothetical protein